MIFRRANGADFDSMVKLQNLNLVSNISDEQKKDGFLSAAFSAPQFQSMDNDGCVIVGVTEEVEGVEETNVKSFLCASTPMFNLPFPLPATMVERFPTIKFEAKTLSDYQIIITGPVCVDETWRGKGVIEKLYKALYDEIHGQYQVAVVFVSVENPRSIKAHEKLGMSVVDKFEFSGKNYVVMAVGIKQ